MHSADGSKRRGGALPRGFLTLALTEYWERFALAGLKSMLTLVLIDHVLASDRAAGAGWSATSPRPTAFATNCSPMA